MKLRAHLIFIAVLAAIALTYENCSRVPQSNQETKVQGVIVGNPFNLRSVALLPKVFLNSDYPVLPGNHRVLTVGATGRVFSDCQKAVDAASPGDEVVIDAGYVCGPLTLRDKGATDLFIVIRSADFFKLEPQGTRLSRANTPHLAVIETKSLAPALSTDHNGVAHNYYIGGLEARLAAGTPLAHEHLVMLGTGAETTVNQLSHDIILSHCWIHGTSTQEIHHGIELNGTRISVVDSIIEEIHRHDQYAGGIAGWNTGTGPFKIYDNEISASAGAFNVGSATTIQDWTPQDIELRKNLFTKPAAWQQSVTGDTGLTGTWEMGEFVALNNAQRVLVDGNIFDTNWVAQNNGWTFAGFALGLIPQAHGTGVAGSGHSWVKVQDITVTNNIFRHEASLVFINYFDPTDSLAVALNVDIENNLAYDIGTQWGGASSVIYLNHVAQGPTLFNHNTFLNNTAGAQSFVSGSADASVPEFAFANNVVYTPYRGFIFGSYAAGDVSISKLFPGFTFLQNAMGGQDAANYGAYAAGNFFPPSMSSIGFVTDPTGGVADYHGLALAPASPYYLAGTDGADLGVNITKLDTAQ